MTGMERNSDGGRWPPTPRCSSTSNWRQWNPDAIDFDSSRVFGTPSYYVQQMFSRNRGDVVLAGGSRAARRPKPRRQGRRRRRRHLGHAGRVQGHQGHPGRQGAVPVAISAKGYKGWQSSTASGRSRTARCGRPAARPTAAPSPATSVDRLHAHAQGPQARRRRRLPDPVPRPRRRARAGGTSAAGATTATPSRCRRVDRRPGRPAASRPAAGTTSASSCKGPQIRCYLDGKLIHDVAYPSLQSLYAVASRAEQTRRGDPQGGQRLAPTQDTEIRLHGVAGSRRTPRPWS